MRQGSCLSRLALAALVFGIAATAAAQPGRVGGIVRDENGDPVKGATITAENENIGSSFTATTDDKGRFTLIGLRGGDVALHRAGARLRAAGRRDAHPLW